MQASSSSYSHDNSHSSSLPYPQFNSSLSHYKLMPQINVIQKELDNLLAMSDLMPLVFEKKIDNEAKLAAVLQQHYLNRINELALELAKFYTKYGKHNLADNYLQISKEVKNSNPELEAGSNFLLNELKNLLSLFIHPALLRDQLAVFNIYRFSWVFCSLSLKYFGVEATLPFLSNLITWQQPYVNFFSVFFFAFRFVVNAIMLLKHLQQALADRSKLNQSTNQPIITQTASYELKKRGLILFNDAVWVAVNFLTNYEVILGPAAVAVMGVGFFVDFCVMIYNYRTELADYKSQKQKLNEQLNPLSSNIPQDIQKDIVSLQLIYLDAQWASKRAKFYFTLVNHLLFAIGISVALLFAPQLFALCYLAAVGNLIVKAYGDYKEKKYLATNIPLFFNNTSQNTSLPVVGSKNLELAVKTARNNLIFAVMKSFLIPPLLIMTVSFCWPAAIALATLLVGYTLWQKSKAVKTEPSSIAKLAKLCAEKNPDPASNRNSIVNNHSSFIFQNLDSQQMLDDNSQEVSLKSPK